MEEAALIRMSKAPKAVAWALTVLSCALVVAAAITGNHVVLTLLAVSVPLTLVAALQATAIAPLAAEVLRLRQENARQPSVG